MKVQTDVRAGLLGIGVGLKLKVGIFLGGLFGCGCDSDCH
jgi:hypothetical protein